MPGPLKPEVLLPPSIGSPSRVQVLHGSVDSRRPPGTPTGTVHHLDCEDFKYWSLCGLIEGINLQGRLTRSIELSERGSLFRLAPSVFSCLSWLDVALHNQACLIPSRCWPQEPHAVGSCGRLFLARLRQTPHCCRTIRTLLTLGPTGTIYLWWLRSSQPAALSTALG